MVDVAGSHVNPQTGTVSRVPHTSTLPFGSRCAWTTGFLGQPGTLVHRPLTARSGAEVEDGGGGSDRLFETAGRSPASAERRRTRAPTQTESAEYLIGASRGVRASVSAVSAALRGSLLPLSGRTESGGGAALDARSMKRCAEACESGVGRVGSSAQAARTSAAAPRVNGARCRIGLLRV
jgi:hypothetical protein